MVNKELKKLSRRELVDIIYQMKQNEQEMQEKRAGTKPALSPFWEAKGSISNAEPWKVDAIRVTTANQRYFLRTSSSKAANVMQTAVNCRIPFCIQEM